MLFVPAIQIIANQRRDNYIRRSAHSTESIKIHLRLNEEQVNDISSIFHGWRGGYDGTSERRMTTFLLYDVVGPKLLGVASHSWSSPAIEVGFLGSFQESVQKMTLLLGFQACESRRWKTKLPLGFPAWKSSQSCDTRSSKL